MKTISLILAFAVSAASQNYVTNAIRTFKLATASTQTASLSVASTVAQGSFAGFCDLIVTLYITAATHTNETYDFYITTTDGVSAWDIVHFPQVATTGAKRFTAIVSGYVYPQNVTTATPGVQAVTIATLQTDTAGSAQGIKTLGAGIVRHGPRAGLIGYELVAAGTSPSITYSITVTMK